MRSDSNDALTARRTKKRSVAACAWGCPDWPGCNFEAPGTNSREDFAFEVGGRKLPGTRSASPVVAAWTS